MIAYLQRFASKIPVNKLSIGLAWLAFLLTLICILVAHDMRIILNADLMYLPTLYKDMTEWGGHFSGWKFSPAPYFFPDMMLFFLLSWFTNNWLVSFILSCIFQIIFYVIGWTFLSRLIFVETKKQNVFQVFLLFVSIAFVFLVTTNYSMMTTLLFSIVNHFSIILITPYILALSITCLRRPLNTLFPVAVALAILSMLITVSDFLFIIQVTIPVLLVGVVLLLVGKSTYRQCLYYQVPIIVGTVSGVLLNKLVIRYPSVGSYVNVDTHRVVVAITEFWEWLTWWITNSPIVSLCMLLTFVILLYKTTRAVLHRTGNVISTETLAISMFTIFSVLINLVVILGTGNFVDLGSSRYIQPLFFFPLYTILLWVPASLLVESATSLIVVTYLLIFLNTPALFRLNTLARYTDYYPPLAQCVDLGASKRGLKSGIAGYWDAKYLTMLSKMDLKIIQALPNLSPFHWISNVEWYRRFTPDFIVVHQNASNIGLQEKFIFENFGQPSDKFNCQDSTTIFVYNESGYFQNYWKNHPFLTDFNQAGAIATFHAAMLPSDTGKIVDGRRIATQEDKISFLTYGPYIQLPRGVYEAQIFYTADQKNSKDPVIGLWDITISLKSLKKLKDGPLSSSQTVVSTRFDMSSSDTVQVRTFFHGNGQLIIDKIVLQKLR